MATPNQDRTMVRLRLHRWAQANHWHAVQINPWTTIMAGFHAWTRFLDSVSTSDEELWDATCAAGLAPAMVLCDTCGMRSQHEKCIGCGRGHENCDCQRVPYYIEGYWPDGD